MENKYKSGEGFCAITLSEMGNPLIIYRVDKESNPVIEEDEIILLRIGSIYEENGVQRARLGINGKSYQFIRGKFFRNYDEEKCKLSKEDFDKLRGILIKKMRGLNKKNRPFDNKNLEKKVEV